MRHKEWEAFLERYQETYGGLLRSGKVKLVNLRTVVVGRRETVRFSNEPPVERHEPRRRPVTFVEGVFETPVVSRAALRPGERREGPVILEQQDSTTVVPPGWTAEVHASGCLVLHA